MCPTIPGGNYAPPQCCSQPKSTPTRIVQPFDCKGDLIRVRAGVTEGTQAAGGNMRLGVIFTPEQA